MCDIKVSVLCITFNHEAYIAKCLDELLGQQTDFEYEIIVHDDASTDSTPKIISEYYANYPEIIRPILQSENQYSKHIKISEEFIYPKCRGKYIALCEGDDFWCDSRKLQKQYDAMEANPNASICVHMINRVDSHNNVIPRVDIHKDMPKGVIPERQKCRMIAGLHFHTTSYFMRFDIIRKLVEEKPEFYNICPVGDELYLFYCGTNGDIYFINEIMSCYRVNVEGSWTWKFRNDIGFRLDFRDKIIKTMQLYDEYTNYMFHDMCTYRIARAIHAEADIDGRSAYRFLLRKKNRAFLRDLRLKERMFIFGKAIFPWLVDLYLKIKNYAK